MASGGNRPRNRDLRKISQQFLSPGQGADLGHLARIGFCVNPLKLSRFRSGNSASRFPQEIICEQTAAHPDTAMDTPYCFCTSRFIFEERRLSDRRILLGCIIRPPDDEELERNPKE